MAGINIQLPAMDAEHLIEIEIRVNGEKKNITTELKSLSGKAASNQRAMPNV